MAQQAHIVFGTPPPVFEVPLEKNTPTYRPPHSHDTRFPPPGFQPLPAINAPNTAPSVSSAPTAASPRVSPTPSVTPQRVLSIPPTAPQRVSSPPRRSERIHSANYERLLSLSAVAFSAVTNQTPIPTSTL